jgi:nucleoid-associated protein YgaU
MWPFGKSTAQRFKDSLDNTPPTKGLNLQVTEQGGVVHVSGDVPNSRFPNFVESMGMGFHGVSSVDTTGLNYPADAAPASASGDTSGGPVSGGVELEADPSGLAKMAYNDIRANGELSENPIDVLQSGNVIVLRGAVDSQHEYNLAVQLAQNTPGVGKVDASDLEIHEGVKEKVKAAAPGYVNIPDEYYTVQAGDTLSAIAAKFYGDEGKYKDIAHANNISNPDAIQVGQKLQIPR